MQTIDKLNISPAFRFPGCRKPFWFSAFTLTASLILAAGCALDERAAGSLSPADSQRSNPERNVGARALSPANSDLESTSSNARDKSGVTLTPEDQGETSGDLEITAAIRRSVVDDESLSLNAHNAKIITRDSVVTLRGPVENSAEKSKLQAIARKVPGVKQVDNQLETKTP